MFNNTPVWKKGLVQEETFYRFGEKWSKGPPQNLDWNLTQDGPWALSTTNIDRLIISKVQKTILPPIRFIRGPKLCSKNEVVVADEQKKPIQSLRDGFWCVTHRIKSLLSSQIRSSIMHKYKAEGVCVNVCVCVC